jgi:N-methylhydantoinase B/oxoprolinase/acetone carboxylase alpha subunit
VWKIYLSNVRTPKNAYGDMKAMHAAMLTADKRVKELVTKYGVGTVKACLAQIKDYSERRMRGEIDQIPDGVYESTDYFEDDGVSDEGPFEIRATVYVEGSDIIIDYTGSSKQAEGPINATYGVTVSDAAIGILMSTDHTIPVNSGCFRPIHVIVPSGTVANVNYPGPCMAGITELGNRLVEAVMNALKPAIPSKAVGSHGGTCVNVTYGGVNPETGEQFAHYQWEGVGWGGTPTHDGNDAQIAYVGNATLQPVEVLDARVPWLTLSLELTPHSGGPGKFRGGLGVTRTMRLTAPEIRLNAMTDRHKLAAQGIFGGKPGATGALLIRTSDSDRFRTFVEAFGTRSPSKFSNIKLHEGDTLVIKSPGGGGYGDPRQRDIQYVLKDVRDGMVSIEDAKEEYAVIIKPETLKVDEEATARLRKRLREQGKGTNELARVQEVHYRSRN